jgi:ankyrin repeat protein
VKAVRFLLSRGANPAFKDTAMHWNSLHIAVSEGKTLVVADICEKTPDLVNLATPEGFSPLYLASLNGKTACVRGLLQAGANVKQYGIFAIFFKISRFLLFFLYFFR